MGGWIFKDSGELPEWLDTKNVHQLKKGIDKIFNEVIESEQEFYDEEEDLERGDLTISYPRRWHFFGRMSEREFDSFMESYHNDWTTSGRAGNIPPEHEKLLEVARKKCTWDACAVLITGEDRQDSRVIKIFGKLKDW